MIGLEMMGDDAIAGAVAEISNAYHRLVLLVGPGGSGKSALLSDTAAKQNWPILNLSLELAKRLQELPTRSRPRKVTAIAEELLSEAGADVVVLDHIELIFEPDLQQDPLRLLQLLSRNRTIVAAWPGTYEAEQLVYAEQGHREYRRYSRPDAQVLLLHETGVAREPENDVNS